jgi:hypothetical protein
MAVQPGSTIHARDNRGCGRWMEFGLIWAHGRGGDWSRLGRWNLRQQLGLERFTGVRGGVAEGGWESCALVVGFGGGSGGRAGRYCRCASTAKHDRPPGVQAWNPLFDRTRAGLCGPDAWRV